MWSSDGGDASARTFENGQFRACMCLPVCANAKKTTHASRCFAYQSTRFEASGPLHLAHFFFAEAERTRTHVPSFVSVCAYGRASIKRSSVYKKVTKCRKINQGDVWYTRGSSVKEYRGSKRNNKDVSVGNHRSSTRAIIARVVQLSQNKINSPDTF